MRHHQILAGPRGRRTLFELLLATEPRSAPCESGRLGQLLWQARVGTKSDEIAVTERLAPETLAAAIQAAPLPGLIDQRVLLSAVQRSVDAAMYWQLPDGLDRLLRRKKVREALHEVAVLVTGSAATDWWSDGFDREAQAWVRLGQSWTDLASHPPQLGAPGERLSRWREALTGPPVNQGEEVGEEHDPRFFTGTWWSSPLQLAGRTSTGLGESGAAGLWWLEDSFGCEYAELVEVDVNPEARIFIITGDSSWVWLCRNYPLDVTGDKGPSWGPSTNRNGSWVMPDWSRVARDFAAVHLTVLGYLGTAGRAIKVDDRAASMIAGWGPGETYWLRDCAHLSERVSRWVGRERSGEDGMVWQAVKSWWPNRIPREL